MNSITDTKVREAITEVVEESIAAFGNGDHFDTVVITRGGKVWLTSPDRAETATMWHNNTAHDVVGSWDWAGLGYEADDDVTGDRDDAIASLYESWLQAN